MASIVSDGPGRRLRLLCFHGHGGHASQHCGNMQDFFRAVANAPTEDAPPLPALECRCVEGPFAESSRRALGREWWKYDEKGYGDRPEDWAEMEIATTRLAEELAIGHPDGPYDGVLGFSQGAEMVHSLALLQHRGDPRFVRGFSSPRFFVSLSAGINEAHFEAPSGGGPPRNCPGPSTKPTKRELKAPCLFVADFSGGDGWYRVDRFRETLSFYDDVTVVEHGLKHSVPKELSSMAAVAVRRFFSRWSR